MLPWAATLKLDKLKACKTYLQTCLSHSLETALDRLTLNLTGSMHCNALCPVLMYKSKAVSHLVMHVKWLWTPRVFGCVGAVDCSIRQMFLRQICQRATDPDTPHTLPSSPWAPSARPPGCPSHSSDKLEGGVLALLFFPSLPRSLLPFLSPSLLLFLSICLFYSFLPHMHTHTHTHTHTHLHSDCSQHSTSVLPGEPEVLSSFIQIQYFDLKVK